MFFCFGLSDFQTVVWAITFLVALIIRYGSEILLVKARGEHHRSRRRRQRGSSTSS